MIEAGHATAKRRARAPSVTSESKRQWRSGRRDLKRFGLPVEALARDFGRSFLVGKLLIFLPAQREHPGFRCGLPFIRMAWRQVALQDAGPFFLPHRATLGILEIGPSVPGRPELL